MRTFWAVPTRHRRTVLYQQLHSFNTSEVSILGHLGLHSLYNRLILFALWLIRANKSNSVIIIDMELNQGCPLKIVR